MTSSPSRGQQPGAGRWGPAAGALRRWIDLVLVDLLRQVRLSYLPPLMVYLAAGISGLTAIVGTFFVKEHFGFPAAFLAGLAFWVGIPWTLKMPLGHLVDLIWRWKALLIYLGAALIAASIAIMYGLIVHPRSMAAVAAPEAWYVISTLLAPIGYVLQDTVADAMTVEAVPTVDAQGRPLAEDTIKAMHTTMQTLGRIAIISGFLLVAGLNIVMFADVEAMSDADKIDVYGRIHLMALAIPVVSVAGVLLAAWLRRRRAARLRRQGIDPATIAELTGTHPTRPNWWILGGGLAFAAFTIATGLSPLPFNQEIVFAGSMLIVIYLIRQLVLELPAADRAPLIGTALIIFAFRAVPLPGPGVGWWEIDVLGFDQQFLSVLSLITSGLTLVGMVALRPLIANRPIADIIVVLAIVSALLALPNIGLFYGLHEWTARLTGGSVDARFIAILDTTLESPLGQIAMIPLLAWIARNAPVELKATFFAVMASFTNLALSANSLATRYLNQVFVVEREVRDRATGAVTVPADYSQLGTLLIVTALIGVLLPVATTLAVQLSPLRTRQ